MHCSKFWVTLQDKIAHWATSRSLRSLRARLPRLVVDEIHLRQTEKLRPAVAHLELGLDGRAHDLLRRRAIVQAGDLQARRPPLRSFLLLTSAFGRRLRLGHFFRHLRFERVKIEARAPLHRRVIEEGLDFLGH